jgi:xanthine dehydrogenase molybdopterin-binding subunit B
MVVIEEIMDRVARHLGLPPEVVRERNLYHGDGPATPRTTARRSVTTAPADAGVAGVAESAFARAGRIDAWNAATPRQARPRDHAGEVRHLVHAPFLQPGRRAGADLRDGSVQVNHGGTEMGQGLHTKIRASRCASSGVSAAAVRVMKTRTDKVPNTSATAASSGADLNGAAVKHACDQLRARLAPVAADLLASRAPRSIRRRWSSPTTSSPCPVSRRARCRSRRWSSART